MSTLTSSEVVRFLGLTDLVRTSDDKPVFPLGPLYPYTVDLQRVCSSYDAMCLEYSDTSFLADRSRRRKVDGAMGPDDRPAVAAFLAAIATLQNRIAFAPGPAGARVATAYRVAGDALTPSVRGSGG